VAQRFAIGDELVVQFPAPPPPTTPAPENVPLTVLYEDDGLVVVDKPAGMVVHPTYKNTTGTLLNALLWRARDWPDGDRPSIVGRLDKLTSGLVVVAKTKRMHAALQRAFASRDTEKDYLALSHGRVRKTTGCIRLRLSRDPLDRRRVVASSDVGDEAETEFERLGVSPFHSVSLLRCRLRTGRTHQIRVHLAAHGHPIVGDQVYTGEIERASALEAVQLRDFPRQALHAWRLSFPHPSSGRRVTVTSPLAADVAALLTSLEFPADIWVS
jgi:23S rRNA pseudouridine1911/1915/1917 synthase